MPTMPDPLEQPKDWVGRYAARMKQPPNWWLELMSLYKECTIKVPMAFIQEVAKRQAMFFWLSAAQAKNLG